MSVRTQPSLVAPRSYVRGDETFDILRERPGRKAAKREGHDVGPRWRSSTGLSSTLTVDLKNSQSLLIFMFEHLDRKDTLHLEPFGSTRTKIKIEQKLWVFGSTPPARHTQAPAQA